MHVREDFLYFLWQYQHFNRQLLTTTDGEAVQVIWPGLRNPNAGPDFSQARIVLGRTEWAGTVEIHVCSSDWDAHRHRTDAAYNSVILHVVWQHDRPIYRPDGTPVPTLELRPRVAESVMQRYFQLQASATPIPCASQFSSVANIHKRQSLDRALMQRLQQKASYVQTLFAECAHDWEETAYRLLARNFGFKVNSDAFQQLATLVPQRLLLKHQDNLLPMEALLFGQAGFLDTPDAEDAYAGQLRREYAFLRHKYQLPSPMQRHEWKFSRLHPANFPTLRIAQFAAVLRQFPRLFSFFTTVSSASEAVAQLGVHPSDYWQTHYVFGKMSKHRAVPGMASRENVLINTAIPLMAGYAAETQDTTSLDKMVGWLETLPAEDNRVVQQWRTLGVPITNAFDSQGGLEWYNEFCAPKKCLDCPVGVSLLK